MPASKCLFDKRGTWSGKDLITIVLDHPATAHRLARRICECFMGEGAVSADELRALADGLRRNALDIGWAVATVLRSRAFFDERNLASRVVGPPEFIVGAVAALEVTNASTVALADWSARLGQDLFYPPNVGGWPGGRGWLGSRGLIARVNFAAAVADGRAIGSRRALRRTRTGRPAWLPPQSRRIARLVLPAAAGPGARMPRRGIGFWRP